MILTAHQPVYLPWLGLFHKIALADLFCYFDIAQYQTRDLNLEMLRFFLRCLDIETPIVKASDYEFAGAKSDLVLDMCVKLGAELYIFGAQGRNYADSDKFRSRGVEPCFQQYNHPSYRQL